MEKKKKDNNKDNISSKNVINEVTYVLSDNYVSNNKDNDVIFEYNIVR